MAGFSGSHGKSNLSKLRNTGTRKIFIIQTNKELMRTHYGQEGLQFSSMQTIIKSTTREVPRGTKFSPSKLPITSLQYNVKRLKHSGKGPTLLRGKTRVKELQ